ncbi:nucleoside transporter-domain-containing protein [Dipodascopsis tothii]|uniref:nucleoside transporter-domain-containing protein n=1 Tax=Dipodascopsis tothii TaxID=44089 RepID=UPI0034CDED31
MAFTRVDDDGADRSRFLDRHPLEGDDGRSFATSSTEFDVDEDRPMIAPPADDDATAKTRTSAVPYNLPDYLSFAMLGVAVLWPWNCFLSAAAYFQWRFSGTPFIRDNFESATMTTSTVVAMVTMLLLSGRQQDADYSARISRPLIVNLINFAVLSVASISGSHWADWAFFIYLIISIAFSAMSTASCQNGMFAIANLFDPIYTQSIMVGQAVSGVLPSIAQILSVVAVEQIGTTDADDEAARSSSAKSSFVYFVTASLVNAVAYGGFALMRKRQATVICHGALPATGTTAPAVRPHVPLPLLLRKLWAPAFAVFFTFAVTMMFPVFASTIRSTNFIEGVSSPASWLRPSVFVPIAFLVWNTGDLLGRVVCGNAKYVMRNPSALTLSTVARLLFIPALLLCNVNGEGAAINSDFLYMVIMLAFGLSNGYVTSCGMMVASDYVEEDEKEATGGFMVLSFNLGLALGSVASFALVAMLQ